MTTLGRALLALPVAALSVVPCPESAPRPNIVLISIDTLRADRVGCYGYASGTTPHIDGLSARGATVTQAWAQVPMTRPSHASIFTGLLPFAHGIRDNFSLPLSASHPTIATVLKASGYATAGFPASVLLSSQSGLNRGFDVYSDGFSANRQANPEFFSSFQKPGDQMADAAIAWLRQNRSQPFFLFLHLYDPHSEYTPPEPYKSRFPGRPYDGEVAFADAQVGRVLQALEESRLRDSTLIVLCSDHGEGLGEHGEEEHLFFVYGSTLRIPLLFSWPGHIPPGKIVSTPFRSIDIMPTMLSLARVGAPQGIDGVDLSATVRGEAATSDPLPSYAETLFPKLHFGWSDLRAVTEGRYKYIRAPRPELYDLETDPGEARNIYAEHRSEATRLERTLDSICKDRDSDAVAVAPPAEASELEALASLGYVGTPSPSGDSTQADPKDKIAEFQGFNRDLREAIARFSAGDDEAAVVRLRSLIERGKSSFEVQFFLGRSLLRLKETDEAIEHLREGVRKMPAFAPIYLELARAYLASSRTKEAIELLSDCVRRDPDNAAFHAYLGFVYRVGGRLQESEREYTRARDLGPSDAETREALAAVLRELSRVEAAETELREAVRLDPDSHSAWNALGMLAGAARRNDEAARCFRKAVEEKPDEAFYRFNLGVVLERTGRTVEARAEYQAALRIRPDFEDARSHLLSLPDSENTWVFRVIRVRSETVASTILRKLGLGEPFESMARQYSVDPSAGAGGRMEVEDPGALREAVRAALESLRPGQRSPIVRDGDSYVILLLERRP